MAASPDQDGMAGRLLTFREFISAVTDAVMTEVGAWPIIPHRRYDPTSTLLQAHPD